MTNNQHPTKYHTQKIKYHYKASGLTWHAGQPKPDTKRAFRKPSSKKAEEGQMP